MREGLDLPAIATFCAFGFFLDDDTYYTQQKFAFDTTSDSGKWLSEFQKFNWYYAPESITLKEATERFAVLLDEVINQQVGNSHVILPLSGGLDSRTLASSLKRLGKKVTAFSYRFPNGQQETKYASKIAKACGFPIETRIVPNGYLWEKIEELAEINHCYSNFTHSRQIAFVDEYSRFGDVFSLGHWGDVLFDNAGVDEKMPIDEQVGLVLKKIIKKGGAELAEDLWTAWGLQGKWMDYIQERTYKLLKLIPIDNSANARMRAFKSKYWATRWTAANFLIFEKAKPITAPYFDLAFCNFICKVPESLLSSRQIQVMYLRHYAPELARITWQAKRPYNLFNFQWNILPFNLPFRAYDKFYRYFKQWSGQKWVQRNWEIQFLGNNNSDRLVYYLNELGKTGDFIPGPVIQKYYQSFLHNDPVKFAHPVDMLLALSCFSKIKEF